ncbi:MAG TPA: hypothetical protein VLJ13_08370 [Brevundimonas sp.]|nr:hypothetical protein [Brevundimonas sp.]
MRRFLIWSGLIVVLGLVLAVGGFWAYQHYYARFQPVTVTRDQAAIQRLLDEASWVSDGGGGQPLYIIGYRDSGAMQRYAREEAPKLRAAGQEIRFIMFARADREGLARSTAAERATVAELWLTRDWTLYQRWAATPVANWTAAGLPAADGSLARGAVVEAGRDFAEDLAERLGGNGLQVGYPLVIWRDPQGFMKACACTDSRSWPFVRDDLGAPDRIDPPVVPQEPLTPPPLPAPGPDSLPYPALPPVAPAPGQTVPVPGTLSPPAPSAAPSRSPGAAPAVRPAPRSATPPATKSTPQPKQQDDATFF